MDQHMQFIVIFLFPISVSAGGNAYFLSLVFVSDELVGEIVSVTDSRHLETCQNSQLIMNAPCQCVQ